MATHSSMLAWRIPTGRAWQATVHGVERVGHDWWTGKPGVLWFMGSQELDATELLNWTELNWGTKHNQGKLKVVKQEMARVTINILGISELKWTGMSKFNLGYHYIYYCGLESLRRNAVTIMVNKRLWNAVLGCNLKNKRMIGLFPRQTTQYHSNPSLCPNQ